MKAGFCNPGMPAAHCGEPAQELAKPALQPILAGGGDARAARDSAPDIEKWGR